MPEGSEIYFLKKSLNKNCKDNTLHKVNIVSGRYKTHGPPKGYDSFKKDLPMKIKEYHNIGKFLWITTDTKWTIWITFGLTGWLERNKPEYDVRVEFNTSKCIIYFTDSRNFGTITFSDDKNALEQKINKLGPDPLNERVTEKELETNLMYYGKNEYIADAIMDQRIIAGVGNYIRAETFYHAHLNPFIKVKNLTKDDIMNLLKSIKFIMKKFLNPNVDYSIYRNKVAPNGKKIKTKETKNGRTLYYVSNTEN